MDLQEPKLTPSELKLIRIKKKREKRFQKRLLKKEKKKQLKRDHLQRENLYGQATIKKYEKNWKEMLTKVAVPRMKHELEFAWHNFERVIDCKDFQISLLMDELKQSEEQQIFSVGSHLKNMDDLMNLFDDRLDELREEWGLDVKNLQNRHNSEIEEAIGNNSETTNYLKTMLYQLEVARRQHERITRAVFFSKLDECNVRNADIFQKLKAILEKKTQRMFDSIKNFLKDFHRNFNKKQRAIVKLKQADDSIQDVITQQFDKIQRLQNTFRELRSKFFDLRQEEGSKLSIKQSQRRYFCKCYLNLKTRLQRDEKNDFDKCALLSQCCAKTFDYLQTINKKGEVVLRLGAICRKFETQMEKVLPFWMQGRGLTKSEKRKAEDDEDVPNFSKELQLFCQRLGEVHYVYLCLKREKEYLMDENQLFIQLHNDYCEKLGYPIRKKFTVTTRINKINGNSEMKKYTAVLKFKNPSNKMK